MFESCRAHLRVSRAGAEVGVVRDLGAHVAERDAVGGARDAADRLLTERELVARFRAAVDLEHAQPAVDLAAVVLPRDRLLPRIAAFAEADVRVLEPGFGRKDRLVELASPARDTRLDAPALDLLLGRILAGRPLVEDLVAADDEPGLVLLGLDLDLRREARALQLRPHDVAELGLGQE